ncbi:MAG: hypothetical protein IPQ06_07335 [Chitinophagaceae bacterium]|nr:hypothetical protein [Chitinophagaceae bacterium]
MSSGIKDKMYNHEVAPPAGVWEKIAAGLDESSQTKSLQTRLLSIQINPPVHVWQSIAAALDEPALVNDYARKLEGLESPPPANAWKKIKDSLNKEHVTVFPGQRKFAPFLKYAVAAVLIGFLAWGGIQLFNNKSGNPEIAHQEITQQKENTAVVSTNQNLNIASENIGVNALNASLDEARNDAALEASKKTFAKLDVAVKRSKIKNAADFFFATDSYEPGTRGLGIEPEEPPSSDISGRYIHLITPDGNIIRMSKKLRELICCVSGEEQDKECIDQMKKWREKIASPSSGHSTSNFMEIFSLVRSMQDN